MNKDRRSEEANAWRHLYSTKEWRAGRRQHLAEHPLCEECQTTRKITPATVVNHRIPHKGDLKLFWDRTNWQSVCKPHHDGPIQRSEVAGFSNAVDADGYPIDPRHPSARPASPG